MARYNLGWSKAINNAQPSNDLKRSNFNKGNNSSKNPFGIVTWATVSNIITDPSYPQGTIEFITNIQKSTDLAQPLLGNLNNVPIAGEMVLIFYLSDVEYSTNTPHSDSNRKFYISGINIWDNPSFNGVSNSSQINNPQNPFYFNPENGSLSLYRFVGDTILEGRFGNSIRLGGSYDTPWISDNKNNPITIISNGENISSKKGNYIVEDINKDLSSIYLTSKQKIPFSIANENFVSYTTKPELPSQFKSPQIIINSDRVVINAKKDSVLISGEKSVGLSSNESINLEAKQVYIEGSDIKLGSKNATEPVLLGDQTTQLLEIIIKELINITQALSTSQIYPAGIPTPDIKLNPVSIIANSNLNKVLVQLNSIKSNFVKTS